MPHDGIDDQRDLVRRLAHIRITVTHERLTCDAMRREGLTSERTDTICFRDKERQSTALVLDRGRTTWNITSNIGVEGRSTVASRLGRLSSSSRGCREIVGVFDVSQATPAPLRYLQQTFLQLRPSNWDLTAPLLRPL